MPWPGLITVLLVCGIWVWTAAKFGPQAAVGCTALLGFILPVWVGFQFFGELIDARMVTSVFALSAYCFHPKSTFPTRLGILDGLMLGVLCVHLFSDLENFGWSITIPMRMYGEWFVPYVMGRLAFCDMNNTKLYIIVGGAVASVLASAAIFECLTEIHLWEIIWGEQPNDPMRNGYRFNLFRAWGNCGHPIYFGALQLSLLPWLLCLWNRPFKNLGGYLLKFLPFIGLAGIFATISRAPSLMGTTLIIAAIGISLPRSRWFLGGVALLILIISLINQDLVNETVHSIGGESTDRYQNEMIVVDGEEVPFTSALARMYLVKVYKRAVYRAGWIGFGTKAVTKFPISVPIGPEDSSAIKRVGSIDNQFLLFTLRFGWTGGILFSVVSIVAVLNWFQRGYYSAWNNRLTCYYLGFTVLALAFVLLTVWMPRDIGFPFFWLIGGASYWTMPLKNAHGKPPHRNKYANF